VAVHTVDKICSSSDKTVCISGSGTIGILIGLIAKTKGANVSFILRNRNKADFLKTLGFSDFIFDKEEKKTFDTVIECVGSNSSLINCIEYVKSKGQVIVVGNPGGDMNLEKKLYWKILRSEISINGVWNSEYKNSKVDDWDKAIDFLYKNNETVSKLITNKYRLEDGIKAFDDMVNSDKLSIKGVFINEK
ncbi:zinc-binding dehydrogenase, partial [bacterium]|nr:zinc-binding dehydrogenase [bacterium]